MEWWTEPSQVIVSKHTYKKENETFLIYKKLQMGLVAVSNIWEMAS